MCNFVLGVPKKAKPNSELTEQTEKNKAKLNYAKLESEQQKQTEKSKQT